jgi:hypothetical protein
MPARRLIRKALPACFCLAVAAYSLRMFLELITAPAPVGLVFLIFGMAAGGGGFGFLFGRFRVGVLVGLAFGVVCAIGLAT